MIKTKGGVNMAEDDDKPDQPKPDPADPTKPT